jgi:hypothetical protein
MKAPIRIALGVALVTLLALAASPARAQEEEAPPLGNLFLIGPSQCLALGTGGNLQQGVGTCPLIGKDINQVAPAWRDLILDENGDGEVTPEEVARMDLDFNQLHQEDGSMAVILLVDDDEPVLFQTSAGKFKIFGSGHDDDYFCDLPGDDEDCDGDNTRGDGIIFAHLEGVGDELGPGTLRAFETRTGNLLGELNFTIVGEPDSITAELLETSISAGLHPADCELPTDVPGFAAALANPYKAVILARVKDEAGTDIASAWVNWTVNDDEMSMPALPDTPTLDLGGFGVGAPQVICGLDGSGVVEVTLNLVVGPQGGLLGLDPAADSEDFVAELTLGGVPAEASLAVTPASIPCDGVTGAEVATTVTDSNGDFVTNGTEVQYSVVALGLANPATAATADGVARSTVTPLASGVAGVTVLVDIPVGSATVPTPYDEDGRDNDGDTTVDENGELSGDGEEFNTNNRRPNDNVIQRSVLVACGDAPPPPPPPPGGGGTGTGGGGGSGGVITGPDTGSGGAAAGTGSLPIWSAVAMFVGAMALVGARLAVRRVE